MPQALIPVLTKLGLSTFAATVAATAITTVATYFVSGLFRGGPPKPDSTERELKSSKPPRIHVLGRRRVFGASMLYTNTTESETVDVWAFCEGPVNSVNGVFLNDDKVTISGGYILPLSDGSYGANSVLAGYNLGAYPNVAHAPVVSRVPAWTANHRGDGIVSGYAIKTGIKSKEFLDIYPQGDNVTMSLDISGHFCHDPRNPASDPYDPATWPYTQNAALHLLWFKTAFKGADYATKIAPVEQYWITAANVCDEAMALSAGGTEPRYRSCVVFSADADPVGVEAEILATFDGWTNEDENGCIRVYAGKLYDPTVSIGPDQIIDYEFQEFVEDENRLNEIIVRHISLPHDFNEVEPDPWRDETDIAARGKLVSSTMPLQVPSHTQARRRAKREMARVNAPQRGKVRVVFSARHALAERYINLNLIEAGVQFFSGRVEIIGGERDYETGGAVLEWVAVSPNTDEWNPATEDGEPAPTQTKTYLPPISPPIIDSAVAQIEGAGTSARIAITFEPVTYSGVTWFARWRDTGDTVWLEAEVSPSGTMLVTGQVPVDANIDVGIGFQASDGRFSGWSATETVSTSTAALAPAAPSELVATGASGSADVTWRNPSSANLSYVRVYRNDANDFGTATDISGALVGGLGQVMTITDGSLAPDTYYYWVVAFNADDVGSVAAGPATASVT